MDKPSCRSTNHTYCDIFLLAFLYFQKTVKNSTIFLAGIVLMFAVKFIGGQEDQKLNGSPPLGEVSRLDGESQIFDR